MVLMGSLRIQVFFHLPFVPLEKTEKTNPKVKPIPFKTSYKPYEVFQFVEDMAGLLLAESRVAWAEAAA